MPPGALQRGDGTSICNPGGARQRPDGLGSIEDGIRSGDSRKHSSTRITKPVELRFAFAYAAGRSGFRLRLSVVWEKTTEEEHASTVGLLAFKGPPCWPLFDMILQGRTYGKF